MATSEEVSRDLEERDNVPGDIGSVLTSISDVSSGMKLEAKDAYGKWYMAKVLEVDEEESSVLVHFDRWNSRYDEHIELSSARLRFLLTERREALERERDRTKKFGAGDMVQARWEDGRMYFGKVLRVTKDMADILFDDGVKYKAPLSEVRKRNHNSRSYLSRNSLSDSSHTPTNSRSNRTKKRCVSNSPSGSPGTPAHTPRRKHRRRLDSDSSDSDMDLSSDTDKTQLLKRRPLISVSSDSDASGTQIVRKKRRKLSGEAKSPKILSPVKEVGSTGGSTECTVDTVDKDEVSETPLKSKQLGRPVGHKSKYPGRPAGQRNRNPASPKPLRRSSRARSVSKLEGKLSAGRRESTDSRTGPQSKFDNGSKGTKCVDKKQLVKVAPKEMVIVWDHNEFKCKVTGCTKSFRKETLLQSHIKHYHTKLPPKQKTPGKPTVKKETQSSPGQSSGGPTTPLIPADSAEPASVSPNREPGVKTEVDKSCEETASPNLSAVRDPEPSPVAAVAVKAESGFEDDTVRCVCGDLTDEGFMIQCEQCLCWQHGDCVGVTKHSAPEKYICRFCTNPPALRSRLKHKFDEGWFGEGSLPSLPGGPQFPHSDSVKQMHLMTDSLHKLRNILHGSKMKLQAAGRVSHPYMRQWARETSHHTQEEMAAYLIKALLPITFPSTANENRPGLHNGSFGGSSLAPLEPLPQSSPSVEPASNGSSGDTSQLSTPDPNTLKLDPLPPLSNESNREVLSQVATPKEEVGVHEFAQAFVNGDSTNWYHRMKLLDHIEVIQDRVWNWMDVIDSQLDDLPEDADSAEDLSSLLNSVQNTMAELRQLQSVVAC